MRGYLTFGHHNACKTFVACMHGSEIICQLLELLCNHLVYRVGKILKNTVKKNFFTFFGWGTWVFLQISHLLATAEKSLLELDTTYPSKDKRSISLLSTHITLRNFQIDWIKARDLHWQGSVVKGEDCKADFFSACQILVQDQFTGSVLVLKAFYGSELKR